jgi:hypothetical protein
MDVRQGSITLAVLPSASPSPTGVDRLPTELPKLRRYLDRPARAGTLQVCQEASGTRRGLDVLGGLQPIRPSRSHANCRAFMHSVPETGPSI